MTEPERALSAEGHADKTARELGREIMGRDLTAEEAMAMSEIFRAAVQALKHGFIRRLADHVLTERETERVEESFEDINLD